MTRWAGAPAGLHAAGRQRVYHVLAVAVAPLAFLAPVSAEEAPASADGAGTVDAAARSTGVPAGAAVHGSTGPLWLGPAIVGIVGGVCVLLCCCSLLAWARHGGSCSWPAGWWPCQWSKRLAPTAEALIEQVRTRHGQYGATATCPRDEGADPDLERQLAEMPPSGLWRGYHREGEGRHAACECRLAFSREGWVSGEGVDDVGVYRVTGQWDASACCSVAFSRQYVFGSRNQLGRINSRENKGHSMEYRGERVGTCPGQGVRGKWYVRTRSHTGEGCFHFWPAMDEWRPVDAKGAFEETPGSACVLCFDRDIDTRLSPCGHVALCSRCARGLSPQRCPICRRDVAGLTGPGCQALSRAMS